jgi:hypothetical protein
MLSWFIPPKKVEVTGGSHVYFDTHTTYISRVCVVFAVDEAYYALVCGSCISKDKPFAPSKADAFIYNGKILIGNVVDGVWESGEWGKDFGIVRLRSDYVTAKPWKVNDIPLAGVISSVQLLEMLKQYRTLMFGVAGVPDFELVEASTVQADDLASEEGARGRRSVSTRRRKGFRLIIKRRTDLYAPVIGDPVTVVAGENHILVGMLVSHAFQVHGTYIVQTLDWFLESKWFKLI